MKRRNLGFSLVELMVVITILGIMAAYVTLSANSIGWTAKQEAERIAAEINRFIQHANKIHDGFALSFGNTISITWNKKGSSDARDLDSIDITPGFTIENDKDFSYSVQNNRFYIEDPQSRFGFTLTVYRDKDGSYYHITFDADGGRIRTSQE